MNVGKVLWLLIEAVLYWFVLFYVVRSAMFFFKNKSALKTLQLKKYFWISLGLGVAYVFFNYGGALWH